MYVNNTFIWQQCRERSGCPTLGRCGRMLVARGRYTSVCSSRQSDDTFLSSTSQWWTSSPPWSAARRPISVRAHFWDV